MKGDAKVVEYLNQGLRSELTAVSQYWLHYRLLDNWGFKDLAKKWREESIEEMHHADKFVERIIFLDGFPNMQVLDPLHIGQTVKEILDCDLAAEHSARTLYQEAATHCHAVQGLCLARPVRGADEGRGTSHRLPRNPARSGRPSSASSSTRSTISASSKTTTDAKSAENRRAVTARQRGDRAAIVNQSLTRSPSSAGGAHIAVRNQHRPENMVKQRG